MTLLPRLEAIAQITRSIEPTEVEAVSISDALGLVLASDVHAVRALPPHDNAAMDGYAIVAEDTQNASPSKPAVLSISEEVAAGQTPEKSVQPGQCVRIFTGGIVPPGADTVTMQENTERIDEQTVRILEPSPRGRHIRRAGEDVRQGARILEQGTQLGPGELAMLAAQGIHQVSVHRRPVVTIIPTGSELCEVGQPLGPAQIYNSNAMMLEAQLRQAGAVAHRHPVVRDDLKALSAALDAASRTSDLIITSGGVSVGDFDHVTSVLDQQGSVSFWKVAIKPGKPLAFGTIGATPLLGLPGNPVSAFVCFELFALPALDALRGQAPRLPMSMTAELTTRVRCNPTREQFLRGRLRPRGDDWCVDLLPHQGSGQLSSLVQVGCLVQVPIGSSTLEAGSKVACFPLPTRHE